MAHFGGKIAMESEEFIGANGRHYVFAKDGGGLGFRNIAKFNITLLENKGGNLLIARILFLLKF